MRYLLTPEQGYYTIYGKWETQIDIYYPFRHYNTNATSIEFVTTSLISPDTYYTYGTLPSACRWATECSADVPSQRLEMVQQMIVPGYSLL